MLFIDGVRRIETRAWVDNETPAGLSSETGLSLTVAVISRSRETDPSTASEDRLPSVV
jgi:hypothetical protein